ncbi:ciliary-associated calcium-binding coiled-coil protein 1-like isoform X2 [Ptychodera flava]|uniref:ciliary-associated calcium-binding coiled-coil protein 1-like isoform X2 n=1 Tax=Ptychodera flava TaxID=63121 RepID=UPI003969CAC3
MSERRLSRKGSSMNLRRGSLPVSAVSPSTGRRLSLQVGLKVEGSATSTSSTGSRKFPMRDRGLRDDEARAQEREGSLAWKVLSNTQMQMLQDLSVEDLEKKLSEILKLTSHHVNLDEGVLLDLYVTGFWWAKEQNFTIQQISGFITVIHTLVNNIKEKKMSVVDNLKEFKKMVAGVGNENCEFTGGLDFFDINQAKTVTDYLKKTLFQHYKLYEFLFHHEREEQIVCRELLIEVLPKADLPYPPPLDEGIDEEIYNNHIATAMSTPMADGEQTAQDAAGGQEAMEAAVSPSPSTVTPTVVDTVESEGGTATPVVDPLEGVTATDVKRIMDEVAKDMLGNLQNDVAKKLKERESEIIQRINKIHRIAET